MSDSDQVDLTTLLGTLRFYSRFRGEIPCSICAKAADRIAELEAALVDADATIMTLNGGEELQSLMRLNNSLVARIAELEAALLKILGLYVGAPCFKAKQIARAAIQAKPEK